MRRVLACCVDAWRALTAKLHGAMVLSVPYARRLFRRQSGQPTRFSLPCGTLPTGRFGALVWEEASMRKRPVTVLPVASANAQHDMEVGSSVGTVASRRPCTPGRALQLPTN